MRQSRRAVSSMIFNAANRSLIAPRRHSGTQQVAPSSVRQSVGVRCALLRSCQAFREHAPVIVGARVFRIQLRRFSQGNFCLRCTPASACALPRLYQASEFSASSSMTLCRYLRLHRTSPYPRSERPSSNRTVRMSRPTGQLLF